MFFTKEKKKAPIAAAKVVAAQYQLSATASKNANLCIRSTPCRQASSRLRSIESITAGMIAGCVTRTSTSPLDVVKILFQVQRRSFYCASTASQKYSGMTQALQAIYSQEGVQGLWKGNLTGCCRLAPYTGSKFFVYDSCKKRFGDENGVLTNNLRFTCGAASGVIATMLTYPLELVRTNIILQRQRDKNINGILDGLRQIYNKKGISGLYRGNLAGIVGAIPFEGVQLACYEYLKENAISNQFTYWKWSPDKHSLNSLDFLAIGSVSGAVAQTIAYPLDVVKKRLQAQIFVCPNESIESHYKGIIHCFRMIIKEEGVQGLYRGNVVNLVRIMPYSAVMFTAYESVKEFFRWMNGEDQKDS